MNHQSELHNYVVLFQARVTELSIDYHFLEALLHAPFKGSQLTEEEFLEFCFFRLCPGVTADAYEDIRSTHPQTIRRAANSLSPATIAELRLLGYDGRRLVTRCKARLQEDRIVRRLHLELFYRLREDLQKLMTRFNTTNFADFLEKGIGPHVHDLMSMGNRLNERSEARNRIIDA
ncbi:MAG TPA: hypothetical protein VGN63_16810 [Flavisolibacter sp.]|nr:hypothetical protein [Flavisolibacter sp.]